MRSEDKPNVENAYHVVGVHLGLLIRAIGPLWIVLKLGVLQPHAISQSSLQHKQRRIACVRRTEMSGQMYSTPAIVGA